ncbi:MAG: hypothetical protein V1494_06445 [Candidatus Diapherotrites archaeon]
MPAWKEFREKLKWLDPFTYVDLFLMPKINPKNNEVISWAVYLVSAFVFAFAIYSILGFILGTGSPMVIVVSGSMEPTMYRGDVIVLQGVAPEQINAPEIDTGLPSLEKVPLSTIAELDSIQRVILFKDGQSLAFQQIGTGDTVVYNSDIRAEPIIHRAIAKLLAKDGVYLLTKGDHNTGVDEDCGTVSVNGSSVIVSKQCINLYPVKADKIQGRAVLKIPLVGYVKLIFFDDLPTLLFGCRNPYGCQFP